jgi:hypothetical protein
MQLSDGLYLPYANRSQHRFVRLLPQTAEFPNTLSRLSGEWTSVFDEVSAALRG